MYCERICEPQPLFGSLGGVCRLVPLSVCWYAPSEICSPIGLLGKLIGGLLLIPFETGGLVNSRQRPTSRCTDGAVCRETS